MKEAPTASVVNDKNTGAAKDNSRILVVTPQPFYEDRGTPIALRYLLQALSELGYTVDLVAFPVGRHIDIPRVSIHRVANPLGIRSLPIGFSFRKLFLDVLLFWKVRTFLKTCKYSYIHAVEEAAFIVECAQRRQSRTPVVYDMASSLPEQLAKLPLGNLRPVRAVLNSIERWIINQVDYVVCSGGLLSHVRTLGDDIKAREWWFPAIADSFTDEEVEAFRVEAGLCPDELLFVYTGSFAPYQGIQIILDAIRLVLQQETRVKFLLVGATLGELEDTRARYEDLPEKQVSVMERIPREEVAKILNAADFLISPRLFGANVPLKVFDYMGAGKPILASDVPAHHAVLDKNRAVFFKNTPEDLARAITDLVQDQDKIRNIANCSKDYAMDCLTWPRYRDFVRQIANTVQASRSIHASAEKLD